MTRPILYFAAGFGTRMRPLTNDRPKPLVEVANKPLLTHARDQRDREIGAEFAPEVVNAHYLAPQIAAYAARHGLILSDESDRLLDTGGGLKRALAMMDDARAVCTMNTDAVWTGPSPLRTLHDAWRDGMGALLLCIPAARATGHAGGGDFSLGPDGRLSRGGDLVYTGAQIILSAPVAAVTDDVFSLNVVWSALEARGELHGVVFEGGWCDVGHPGGIALAEAMLEGAS